MRRCDLPRTSALLTDGGHSFRVCAARHSAWKDKRNILTANRCAADLRGSLCGDSLSGRGSQERLHGCRHDGSNRIYRYLCWRGWRSHPSPASKRASQRDDCHPRDHVQCLLFHVHLFSRNVCPRISFKTLIKRSYSSICRSFRFQARRRRHGPARVPGTSSVRAGSPCQPSRSRSHLRGLASHIRRRAR